MRVTRYFILLLLSQSFLALSQNKSIKKPPSETKSMGQVKQAVPDTLEYDHFYLMYIDNSHAERGDELTGIAKDMIEHIADSVSKAADTKFLIYSSNGIDALICDDPQRVSKLIGNILDGVNTSFPDDKNMDKDQMRNAIYSKPFRVSKDMRFDYFVTEFFAKSLLKEDGNLLVASFVNEICFMMADSNIPVILNFYYTNKTDQAKKDTLKNLFSFKNQLKNLEINVVPFN